jgi:hypothetical protein
MMGAKQVLHPASLLTVGIGLWVFILSNAMVFLIDRFFPALFRSEVEVEEKHGA